jgi:hypothetical protein
MEDNIMRKYFVIVPFVLFIVLNCAEDPILGQWERFGDDAVGSVVQVEVVGDVYHGRLIHAEGILNLLGFAANDIKWRDIERVGPNKWKGKDLIKKIDPDGNIKDVEYKDVYFTLKSDGVLEIRKFAKESKLFGETQQWRKIQ